MRQLTPGQLDSTLRLPSGSGRSASLSTDRIHLEQIVPVSTARIYRMMLGGSPGHADVELPRPHPPSQLTMQQLRHRTSSKRTIRTQPGRSRTMFHALLEIEEVDEQALDAVASPAPKHPPQAHRPLHYSHVKENTSRSTTMLD